MATYSRALAWLILFFCGGGSALAEYSFGPASLNAFGTLGGAWLSNSQVDYSSGPAQSSGPGRSWNFDTALDSRVGGQLNISPTLSTLITAQAVAERLPDGQFLPRLTIANIRQEFLNDFAIRVGRIQSPMYLAAEYRLANFSNPWVRTPRELYALYPLTHQDGVDVSFRHDTFMGQITMNSGYGWLDQSVRESYGTANIKLRDLYFVTARLDNGRWRLKLSMLNTTAQASSKDVNKLVNAVKLFGDPQAARQVDVDGKGYSVYSVGLSYDSGDWLFMGEWAITRSDTMTILPDLHGGYLTAGYHIGRFMPQVTLGYQNTQNRRVHGNNPSSDSILKSAFAATRNDYRTVAFGLNYAATDSIILRGQVDLIQPNNGSNGPYIVGPGSRYNPNHPGLDELVSLTLDFIY